MKKAFLFLSIAILGFSCSSDSESPSSDPITQNDEIVGTWTEQRVKWYDNDGSLVDEHNLVAADCYGMTKHTFSGSGSWSKVNFENDGSGCTQMSPNSGDWSKSGSQYEVDMPGYTDMFTVTQINTTSYTARRNANTSQTEWDYSVTEYLKVN